MNLSQIEVNESKTVNKNHQELNKSLEMVRESQVEVNESLQNVKESLKQVN